MSLDNETDPSNPRILETILIHKPITSQDATIKKYASLWREETHRSNVLGQVAAEAMIDGHTKDAVIRCLERKVRQSQQLEDLRRIRLEERRQASLPYRLRRFVAGAADVVFGILAEGMSAYEANLRVPREFAGTPPKNPNSAV